MTGLTIRLVSTSIILLTCFTSRPWHALLRCSAAKVSCMYAPLDVTLGMTCSLEIQEPTGVSTIRKQENRAQLPFSPLGMLQGLGAER